MTLNIALERLKTTQTKKARKQMTAAARRVVRSNIRTVTKGRVTERDLRFMSEGLNKIVLTIDVNPDTGVVEVLLGEKSRPWPETVGKTTVQKLVELEKNPTPSQPSEGPLAGLARVLMVADKYDGRLHTYEDYMSLMFTTELSPKARRTFEYEGWKEYSFGEWSKDF